MTAEQLNEEKSKATKVKSTRGRTKLHSPKKLEERKPLALEAYMQVKGWEGTKKP